MSAILANGLKLEADTLGDPQAPAVLLIRGLGTQMCQWPGPFVRHLVDAGLRVVLFDNRDVGLSDKLDHLGTPDFDALATAALSGQPYRWGYSLADMADDAVGVLDAFGITRAHVVGMSMGGMIAQHFAARQPARTLSLVSIMSTSGAPGLPGPTAEALQALLESPPSQEREVVVRHAMAARRVIGSPAYPSDDATLYEELATAYDRCFHPVGSMRQFAAIAADGCRAAMLRTITAPTLVLHGGADPLVHPDCGRDTASHIPGATYVEYPGMGHDLPPALLQPLAEAIIAHANTNP